MKKILFIILLLTASVMYGQITPPRDSTAYYKFKLWNQGDNPGDSALNQNWKDIDYNLYNLVVITDSTQLVISDDTLKFSPYASGFETFETTATVDTITNSAFSSSDIFVVSPAHPTVTGNDVLSIVAEMGRAIVRRPSSGTSGLKYNWIRIKK